MSKALPTSRGDVSTTMFERAALICAATTMNGHASPAASRPIA